MDSLLHRDLVPEFPSDIPTHPLEVIDYHLITQGDTSEIDRLWKACRNLGVGSR